MLAVFQSIRDGAGCTTIAASVSWHLSRFRPKVLAVAVPHAAESFRSIFNIPDNLQDQTETIWSYGERLVLVCPTQSEFAFSPQAVESLIATAADKAFSDIIVDMGRDQGAQADCWRSRADVVITVCEADHNTLMRLSKMSPADNEFVLINKADGGSEASRTALRCIRQLPLLAGKVLSLVVPRDELAAQAAFMNGPVAQLACYAESARVMSALGTWLTVNARTCG